MLCSKKYPRLGTQQLKGRIRHWRKNLGSQFHLNKWVIGILIGLVLNNNGVSQTSNTKVNSQAALATTNKELCNSVQPGVLFKNSTDGSLMGSVAAIQAALNSDAQLWQQGKSLPDGAYLEMMLSDASAPADGFSRLLLKVQVFQADGQILKSPTRLNIDTSLGRLALDIDSIPTSNLEVVTSTGQACVYLVSPTIPGQALLATTSGRVKASGNIQFTPHLQPLMMMGLLEGVVGKVKLNRDTLSPYIQTTGFEDSIRKFEKTQSNSDDTVRRSMGIRASFFVKGVVQGKYLLTAAYDSEKVAQAQLFKDIDPNAFYPVYGDNSIKGFDAQSNSPLFVRVDVDKNFFLYGDFNTQVSDSAFELAKYNRSATGIKSHFENENIKATVWASQDTLRAYVDEQPARGMSGPYAVAQPNAVTNSEKIELLVRHKDNPSLILKREVLVRFTDYDFEPFTGKVVFKKPVPSVDENFNPVFIRIAYEVNTGGEKYLLAGANAQVNLGNLSLGASHVQDQTPHAPYQLSGLSAGLKMGDNTQAVVELARSQGNQFYNRSLDSVIEANSAYSEALGGVLPNSQLQSGKAVRAELNHESQNTKLKAFYAKADAGFQNSNAPILANRQNAGLNAQYQVNADVAVQAEVLQYSDLSSHSKKELAKLGFAYQANKTWTLEASINKVKEEGIAGGLSAASTASAYSSIPNLGWADGSSSAGVGLVQSKTQAGDNNSVASNTSTNKINNQYTSALLKATAKVDDKISVTAEHELALNDVTKNRSALGAQYQFTDKSKVYAKAEVNNDLQAQVNGVNLQGNSTQQAVVGIDAQYTENGQVYSEYRLSDVGQGLNASNAVGIRQLWKVSEALTLNTGIEQLKSQSYDGVLDTTRAYNLGALYQANANTKLGGKLEYRTNDGSDQWLGTAALDYKISDNWSALARDIYISQRNKQVLNAGELVQNRLQAGVAYRDTETNRLSAFAKLEHRSESSNILADEKDNQTSIASVHLNYKPLSNVTVQTQVAQKIVRERIAQSEIRWRGALLAGRVSFDLTDVVDVSLMGSVAQSNGTTIKGYGAEIGLKVYKNAWLGLSYTKGNYSDLDLYSANASWTGWHARLNVKFDEVPFNGNRQMIN